MDGSFDFFDIDPNKAEPEEVKVTPIKGGNPTQEELTQAVDDLFEEIYFGHFKGVLNESGIKKNDNR